MKIHFFRGKKDVKKKFETIACCLTFFIFIFSTFPVCSSSPTGRYLIMAATSGLGTAICETLASERNELILAGRDEKKLKNLKSELEKKYSGRYTIALFDYSEFASLQKLKEQLNNTPINGIVVIPPRVKIPTSEVPSSGEWADMVQIGFIAPIEGIKQVIPLLQSESSIVIISGTSSANYLPTYKNVNVLRKMWVAEAKNLVYQLGDRNIRTNVISPGVILTDYHKDKVQDRATKNKKTITEQLDEETRDIPLRRYGQPSDVAQAVAFLLSNKSTYINGINLIIDGGLNKAY